jgi:uncharacterized protein (AIM24 family)
VTATTTGTGSTYTCTFCRTSSVLDPGAMSCPGCGAPVDVKTAVSDSGWVKQPAIKDMATLRFSSSSAQISGTYVPVTEIDLGGEDWIYFSHHTLLHVDPSVKLKNMSLQGGVTRSMRGLPVFMLAAAGPGHIALSHDHPGETIAVPLQAGQVLDVAEHRLLAATGGVQYRYQPTNIFIETARSTSDGTEYEYMYPAGQYFDQFGAAGAPGLLLLHAPGNVMVRDLQPGQTIVVQPNALVYKDPSVTSSLHLEYPANASMFNSLHIWLRLDGPGRVAISSVYEQPERLNGRLHRTSTASRQAW